MRDRMSPEQLARAKGQSQTTNRRNQLAHVANGFGASRVEKRGAEKELAGEVGPREARRLMRQAARKVVKGTF